MCGKARIITSHSAQGQPKGHDARREVESRAVTDRLHDRATGSCNDLQIATGSFLIKRKCIEGQDSCRKMGLRVTHNAICDGGKDCTCECLIADLARPLQHHEGPRMMDSDDVSCS